jgi:hypothetical protein
MGLSILVDTGPVRNLGKLRQIGHNKVMAGMPIPNAISQKFFGRRYLCIEGMEFLKKIILSGD